MHKTSAEIDAEVAERKCREKAEGELGDLVMKALKAFLEGKASIAVEDIPGTTRKRIRFKMPEE